MRVVSQSTAYQENRCRPTILFDTDGGNCSAESGRYILISLRTLCGSQYLMRRYETGRKCLHMRDDVGRISVDPLIKVCFPFIFSRVCEYVYDYLNTKYR